MEAIKPWITNTPTEKENSSIVAHSAWAETEIPETGWMKQAEFVF